jgi:hypothetical protein
MGVTPVHMQRRHAGRVADGAAHQIGVHGWAYPAVQSGLAGSSDLKQTMGVAKHGQRGGTAGARR